MNTLVRLFARNLSGFWGWVLLLQFLLLGSLAAQPTVTSIVVSDATLSDPDAGGNLIVDVNFDSPMDADVPVIVFSPDIVASGVISLSGGTWTSATQYTYTYAISDNNADVADVDIEISGAKSATVLQTPYTSLDRIDCKFTNPSITAVSVNAGSTLIDDAMVGPNFYIEITFSEAMDAGVTPVISFPTGGENPAATFSSSAQVWSGGNTVCRETYTVADADQNVANIDFRITAAKDVYGNQIALDDRPNAFSIDMDNPQVSSVTVSDLLINDADAGSSLIITVVFDQNMNTGVNPSLAFPVENPGATLTLGLASWINATTFQRAYTVADANMTVANVDIQVSGGEDAVGNQHTLTPNHPNEFSIDTRNPTVASVTPNLATITDANVGASTFSLSILFDEDMDTGLNPNIGFDVENPTLTIAEVSKLWQPDNRTLLVSYTVSDVNASLANIDVLVTSGRDLAGNTASTGDFNNLFNIQMNNPTVTSITPSIATVTDPDAGGNITLTIAYDMVVNSYPTVVLSPAVGATLTQTGQAGVNTATVVYTYSITDANQYVTGVDVAVSGATSTSGNAQNAYNGTDVFNVDMSNPLVLSVTPNISRIIDSHVGTGTFSLTVKYDKPMDTGVAPSITSPTGGENAFNTLSINGSSTWTNATTYVAYFNVADVNELVNNIDIQVQNAQDANGNTQSVSLNVNLFSIETNNPSVTAVVANDALVTDSNVGTGTFFVTITYSKDMNTAVIPAVTFNNPIDAGTFVYNSGTWLDARNCQVFYNVVDNTVTVSNVDVYLAGTTVADLAGNRPAAYTQADLFSIDTSNPVANTLAANLDPVRDANVGASTFSLTFDFSEAMITDGSANPTVDFPVENPGATLVQSGVTWPLATRCVVSYNVADANQQLSGIDVRIQGAKDLATNSIPVKVFANAFSIDMANPAVVTMTIASNNVNNTALAKVADQITVNFTVNRALGALPTATIAGKVATVTSTGALSYKAVIAVAGGDPEGAVAVSLSFVDTNGNPGSATQANITNASSVQIDRTAPSAELLATNVTQYGGSSVAISVSDHIDNKIWLAGAGKTVETDFSAGATMTTAADGFATTILAPATAGTYYIYVVDDAGNVSAASSKTLTVNNDPKLSNMEATALTWTEGDAALQITNTLLVEDDSDNIVSALVSVGNYDNAGDRLNFTNTPKITGVWNPGTGQLSLTGNATRLEYTTALRSIRFESTSQRPNDVLTRSISFRVNDGFVNSNTQARNLNVVEVNDPPVITSVATTVGRQGQVYSYELYATDPDDVLNNTNVSLTTHPAWLPAAPGAGGGGIALITGTATQPPRSNPVVVQVNDGRVGGIVTQSFTIIVSAAIVVDPLGGADFTSLQAALDDPTTQSGDRIELVDGTYNENIVFPISKNIEVVGNTTDPTRVRIVGDGTTSVVVFSASARTQSLEGVMIEGGIGKTDNWVAQTLHGPEARFGGGLFIEGCSPRIENCIVRNNTAGFKSDTNNGGSGGGVYIGRNANPSFVSCTIENNTAEVYRGGGVCIDLASATFTNCIIRSNTCGSYGGGMAIFDSSVSFNSVTVDNNTATTTHSEGGGVYLHQGTLTRNMGSISGNTAVRAGNQIYGYQSSY